MWDLALCALSGFIKRLARFLPADPDEAAEACIDLLTNVAELHVVVLMLLKMSWVVEHNEIRLVAGADGNGGLAAERVGREDNQGPLDVLERGVNCSKLEGECQGHDIVWWRKTVRIAELSRVKMMPVVFQQGSVQPAWSGLTKAMRLLPLAPRLLLTSFVIERDRQCGQQGPSARCSSASQSGMQCQQQTGHQGMSGQCTGAKQKQIDTPLSRGANRH